MKIQDKIFISFYVINITVALVLIIYAIITKNKEALKNFLSLFIVCLSPFGILIEVIALMIGVIALMIGVIALCEYIFNKITQNWK